MDEYKKCLKCGESKPHSEFYRHPTSRDRLQSYCKACQTKPRAERQPTKTSNVPDTKVCRLCQEEKAWTEFYKDGRARDGLSPRCKDCHWLRIEKIEEPLSAIKKCSRCKVEFPRTREHFAFNPKTRDKLGSWCRACRGIRGEENRLRPRRQVEKEASSVGKWVALLKEMSECMYCGENAPECLEFHHRERAQKSFTVSQAKNLGKSLDQVKAEILKCDIVCTNCHRRLHWSKTAKPKLKYRLNGEEVIRSRFDLADEKLLHIQAQKQLARRRS